MRRTLVTLLAVPALLLAGCGDDAPVVTDPTTAPTEDAPATDEPTETGEPTDTDPTETDSPEDATETDEPTETAGGSTADGQAAADRAKAWLVAFASGEDEVCDLMLDLSSEGPMAESQSDYDICLAMIPATAGSIFTPEIASVIAAIEINGAEVSGDEAVVDSRHFSELFAEGFGNTAIRLKQVDGEWYVDFTNSTWG